MPGKEVPVRIDHLDDAFSDSDVLEAFRNRAQETAEWLEHKRWHEEDLEHRGQAALVTSWDSPEVETLEVPVRAQHTDDAPVRAKSQPLWAGCTCKNPALKLAFGDDGDIKSDLPQQIETNAYGVAAADQAVSYLGNAPAGSVSYSPTPPPPNVSYQPSPAHHSSYQP